MKIKEASPTVVHNAEEVHRKNATINWAGRLFMTLLFAMIGFSCKKDFPCKNCEVQSQPPIAHAKPDQQINVPTDTILLDGSASRDPNGLIAKWRWQKISGPAFYHIDHPDSARTVVKNLVPGVYQFQLTITDYLGLSAKDTMTVTVDTIAAKNRPPVANAGADTTIILPANSAVLNGSGSTDPGNNINAYQWTKISGPDAFNIADANVVQTQVTNLVAGVYKFELKVTDASGLYAKDTVQVTIVSSPPQSGDVYVAGASNINVVLWKNGVAQNLASGNYDDDGSAAKSVYVAGGDVYVAGFYADKAALWKNGVAQNLTDGANQAQANSIYVAGSDVYVAGFASDRAMLWKNGVATMLGGGSANGVFVAGSDVYVVGSAYGGAHQVARLWKNGVAQNLTDSTYESIANSVFVSGSDVYVAGYEKNTHGYKVAKLWKNGVVQDLTDGYHDAEANSIYVAGTDVYVVGFDGGNGAMLWKNGVAQNLTGSIGSSANSVCVSGNDVYVAGTDIYSNVARLWKNGVATTLGRGSAISVFVVK
jgi:hypothetical protein